VTGVLSTSYSLPTSTRVTSACDLVRDNDAAIERAGASRVLFPLAGSCPRCPGHKGTPRLRPASYSLARDPRWASQAGKELRPKWGKAKMRGPCASASRPNFQWCILREPVWKYGPRLCAQVSDDSGPSLGYVDLVQESTPFLHVWAGSQGQIQSRENPCRENERATQRATRRQERPCCLA